MILQPSWRVSFKDFSEKMKKQGKSDKKNVPTNSPVQLYNT